MSWCFTGGSNQTYHQYHLACSTAPTASMQATEVWSTQREQWKRKQRSTTKAGATPNNHVYEETSGKEGPIVKWDGHFSGRTTIIDRGRRHNQNTIFQRPGPYQANPWVWPHSTYCKSFLGGKKVHQFQWKCQTPRLRLTHQSRGQRPQYNRNLTIQQTASEHPDQDVSLKHQRNMDMNKTLKVTF